MEASSVSDLEPAADAGDDSSSDSEQEDENTDFTEEMKTLFSISDNEPTQMFADAQTCYQVASQSISSSNGSLRWYQLIWTVAKVSFTLRPKIVLSMLCIALLSSIFRILSPKALQSLIDAVASTEASASFDFQTLLLWGAVFAGSHWAFSVLEVLLSRISQCFAFWLEDVWHTAAIHHALTLPLAFHNQHDSGALASRIERGASEIGRLCMSLLGDDVIISTFTVVSSTWMAIRIMPESWWIFLVPLPIYVTATHYFEKKSQLHFLSYRPLSEIVDTTRADAFRSIASVKLFGREKKETLKMTRIFTMMRMKEISGEKMYLFKRVIEESVEMLAKLCLISVCLPRLQDGSLSIGQLALLLSLQSSCFTPLDRVNNCIVDTNIAVRKIRPLVNLLATEDDLRDKPEAVDLPTAVQVVELNDVSFRYNSRNNATSQLVLDGVNLTIRKGMTAIVGRSGAGKSTLSSLLLRFYDPQRGQILWNDVDLRDSTKSSRHKQIAVVPQDAALFNRSIRENIAFGRPDSTLEEIVEAAKVAYAHEFITNLPKGYDSIVGERGVLLSGGQRQRLAIARAVLMRPAMLILDESTSHLDSESERAIQQAMDSIEVPIKVVIAHRLSTIANADQIVVVDAGKVVACGKHEELKDSCELYGRLYQLQFAPTESAVDH